MTDATASFHVEIGQRVRDLNMAAHVDNVEAIRIIEEARMLLLRSPIATRPDGLPVPFALLPPQVGDVVGAQRVDFRAELLLTGRPYLVRSWIGHLGSSSFDVCSELRTEQGGEVAVAAETSVVMVDHHTGRPWTLDDKVREALTPMIGTPIALRPRRVS